MAAGKPFFPSGEVTRQRPARRFFYGWVIVAVTGVIGFSEVTLFNGVLSVFLVPMSAEMGWSRGAISGAVAVGVFLGGFLSMALGPVFDRHGARVALAVSGAVCGCFLLAVAAAHEIWQFYFFYGIARVAVEGGVALGLSVVVSNWFVARRSRAMGISMSGNRVGGAVLPPLLQALIGAWGWRAGWTAAGLLVLACATLPALLLLRRRPEDEGLLPDGRRPDERPQAGPAGRQGATESMIEGWALGGAVRTRAFWLLTAATMASYLVFAGTNLHLLPFLLDRGISPWAAVAALSLHSAISALAGVAWGIVADRVSVRWMLCAVMGLGSLAALALLAVADDLGALAYAVLSGCVFGGVIALTTTIFPLYFGRRSLGAIRGVTQPFLLVGNAAGPLFAGWTYDVSGAYAPVFISFAVIYGLGALALAATPPARPAPAGAGPPEV